MKLIVITPPHFLREEARLIVGLLERGADRIHLRKPGSDKKEMAFLIEQIPRQMRQQLSVHEHFDLAGQYGLGGIHLNTRAPFPPQGYTGILSRSCHSINEVTQYKPESDYLFLSPIFDSISKEGYKAAFSKEELDWAMRAGVIDRKVVALGGVTAQHIGSLKQWHFGGMAMLGEVWKDYHDVQDTAELYHRFEQARAQASSN